MEASPGKTSSPKISYQTGKTVRITLPYHQRRHKTREEIRRTMPKKGGGGGKGTWGRPGDELNSAEGYIDQNDPNFDADEIAGDNYVIEEVRVELTLDELTKIVSDLLKEYFESGDSSELIDTLRPLNFDSIKHELVIFLINLAMDNKNPARELTSVLLSDLYGIILTEPNVEKGFHELLDRLDDLKIDIPDAVSLCARFMARAVADDILPPKFLMNGSSQHTNSTAQDALAEARVLFNMKHGLVRLSEVWGGHNGGGFRPVKQLMKKIMLLLQEYLTSGDKAEAQRCLAALETPHFHHEVVYEAIFLALENGEHEQNLILNLLREFKKMALITDNQMMSGFDRFSGDLNDIALDIPNVHMTFKNFATTASADLIPESFLLSIPVKGRKRYASENDGGVVKE